MQLVLDDVSGCFFTAFPLAWIVLGSLVKFCLNGSFFYSLCSPYCFPPGGVPMGMKASVLRVLIHLPHGYVSYVTWPISRLYFCLGMPELISRELAHAITASV